MFDHLGIVFRDLRVAGAFYRAVLTPLGIKAMEDHTQPDGMGGWYCLLVRRSLLSSWWRPAG
jgi:hypothetical protein